MLKKIGLLLAILLLGYGLIRIGVGGALLGQSLGVIDFPDLATASAEVEVFTEARAHKQIVPFNLPGYFAYIVAMGVFLSAGAVGVICQTRWGFVLLGLYLVMHAALFVNYQEINPKLAGLVVQFVMLLALFYLRPPKVLR